MTPQRFNNRQIPLMVSRKTVARDVVAKAQSLELPTGWWIIPSAGLGLAAYSAAALLLWYFA